MWSSYWNARDSAQEKPMTMTRSVALMPAEKSILVDAARGVRKALNERDAAQRAFDNAELTLRSASRRLTEAQSEVSRSSSVLHDVASGGA